MTFDSGPNHNEAAVSRPANAAEKLLQQAIEVKDQEKTNEALTVELSMLNQTDPQACTEAFYTVYNKQATPESRALSVNLVHELGINYEVQNLEGYGEIAHLVVDPLEEDTIAG